MHITKLAFTEKGLLPKGIHTATLPELKESFLVSGNGTSPTWDAAWRLQLVNNLGVLFKQLNQIGISEVFIDGSFVEDIDHPNDIDGYFNCSLMSIINGENEKNLNHLDPKKSWGWSDSLRTPYRGYEKRHLPMWHAYRVELWENSVPPLKSRDNFQEFFSKTRSGDDKGIVKISV